jgi:ribosome-associated protein
MSERLFIHAGLVIPGAELTWTSVRASGPGGQNVNKVASKVELRYDLAASRALPEDAKMRLRALAGARLTADGQLVVVSQLTRDRSKNIEDARSKLAELVRKALVRPKKRRRTAPSASSERRRIESKRRQARKKLARRTLGD